MTELARKITKKQAAPIVKVAYPDYTGNKFSLVHAETLWIYDTNWSGGSRNEYKFVNTKGAVLELVAPAPWNNPYEGADIKLPMGVLAVVHTYFRGRDCGITIYANMSYLPKWLEGGTK
jgi:hypothetical protein